MREMPNDQSDLESVHSQMAVGSLGTLRHPLRSIIETGPVCRRNPPPRLRLLIDDKLNGQKER